MARRTQTNTGRRETNDRRRENDVRTNRTNSQMKRIIKGILGEQGKDKTYEERGAGKRQHKDKHGPAGQDKTKTEDKDGPAGRDRTKTEDTPGGREGTATKDRTADRSGGARPDQGPGGSNGRYYYPLVMPGLGEAPDNSTLAQCTGTARSTVHYQDTKDNPPNPQHQEDDDAKRGTTNTRKTRGKKRARGTVGGYKRPVVGRYHKEGTDPHRQKPNNGNLTGDKESNAKDSGGGNKTCTGGLNRDDRDHEGRDNGTKTGAAKREKKAQDRHRQQHQGP